MESDNYKVCLYPTPLAQDVIENTIYREVKELLSLYFQFPLLIFLKRFLPTVN